MKVLKQLLSILSKTDRMKLLGLTCLMLFSSLLDIIGVGSIIPFLKIVGNPALLSTYSLGEVLISTFHLQSSDKIILSAGMLLGLFFLFKSIYYIWYWNLTMSFIQDRTMDIMRRLYSIYLSRSFIYFTNRNPAELIRNLSIEATNAGGTLKVITIIFTELIVLLGILGLLFFVEPTATLGAIIVLGPIVFLIYYISKKKLSVLSKERVYYHAQMLKWINQGIGGIKEIKILQREQFFLNKFEKIGRGYTNTQKQSAVINAFPRAIIEASAILSIISLIIYLILAKGNIERILPILGFFGVAIVRLIPSFTRLINALNNYRFLSASVSEIWADIQLESAPSKNIEDTLVNPTLNFRESIGLKNIYFSYSKESKYVIQNISLKIPKGKVTAIVGSSGAGKTTLINLILGLLTPIRGTLHIDNQTCEGQTKSWKRLFAYIPQDIYILDDTIRRNIAIGIPDGEIDDNKIWESLKIAKLDQFVDGLENGLATVAGDRGMGISGGQRQRLGIARALYFNADILVFDEATSSLDLETERQIIESIYDLAGKKTILIVTHKLSLIKKCDNIYWLENGKVEQQGDYLHLFSNTNPFIQVKN